MSDMQESSGKPAGKRGRPSRSSKPSAPRPPQAYVAMHEVNAAICIAGGILAPRLEESAARDHHVAAGGLQVDFGVPSASSLAGAAGDLPYGTVVVFELQPPVGGPPWPASLPLLRATRLAFESQEALQLFRARMSGYGDVPEDVLPMEVDAALFSARGEPVQASIPATAPVTDDGQVVGGPGDTFKAIDRCAGGLLGALSTVREGADATRLLVALGSMVLGSADGLPVGQFASTVAIAVDPSHDAATFAPVLRATVLVLSSGAMDDGFSARSFVREAEPLSYQGLEEGSPQQQAIHKFWAFTRDVLELRRDIPEGAWSDEGGSAMARGALLFMLNPEPEQLHAVRGRTPNLGSAVYLIAGLLVGIRSGLTRMGREIKAARGPFLAGAAFAHDWLRGLDARLVLQRGWDSEDGASRSWLEYAGVSIAAAREPANPLQAALVLALRGAGVGVRFLPATGELSATLGTSGPESSFGVTSALLPAFPRQEALEVFSVIPTKLTRTSLGGIVSELTSGTFEHGVFAQACEDSSGRAAVRLSVLVMGASESQALRQAIGALVDKVNQVVARLPVKTPRRATKSEGTQDAAEGPKSV